MHETLPPISRLFVIRLCAILSSHPFETIAKQIENFSLLCSGILKFRNSLCLNQQLDHADKWRKSDERFLSICLYIISTWRGRICRLSPRFLYCRHQKKCFTSLCFSGLERHQGINYFCIFLYRRNSSTKKAKYKIKKEEILFYFLRLKTSVRKIVGEIYFRWRIFFFASFRQWRKIISRQRSL